MAFQTIQVNLEFNVNVARAKQQIADLQTQLQTLTTSQPMSQLSLTPQLQQAQQAASQLRIALQNATNINTGKLNLTQFQAQLKMSGLTLKQLASHMQALGPQGVQAFSQLSTVIGQANTRMFTLGASAKSFLTSIAHSAKYQLASGMIYGTINAFSKILDYAKELDTSLNNIRIVTNKNANEMQRFAKEANNAAKSLSTTTTKYTDASLIYYQQGLGDAEVKERTDTTVKLANVSGKSAQEVSEWMTAIWNNFDDGSEKLEYYADVLADLGASTASSASEIADGLEKFAAVADTVGLSYEYAASALATITAETRQSADVVGTALKTLFARIEGLRLGDTLEDGTTLNQYSEALSKVGVHIKDANGELKDMDTILRETGMRWDTLAKDQQVALAQQVAGIRQYTQFMALMDNWDVMERNLDITKEANGTLEEQQQIYETSAEAAKKRKDAALEEFKTLIVGGEDLTKVYNFVGGFVEVLGDVFESVGGLKTILLGVAAALLKVYQPQVVSMFQNLGIAAQDFAIRTKNLITKGSWSGGMAHQFQNEALSLANNMLSRTSNETEGASATTLFNEKNLEINRLRLELSNQLSTAEKQLVDWEMEIIQAQQKQIEQNEIQLQQSRALADSKATEAAAIIGIKNNESTRLSTLNMAATAVGKAEGHSMYAMNTLEQVAGAGTLNQASRTSVGMSLNQDLQAMKTALQEAGITIDTELQAKFTAASDAITNYVDKGKSKLAELQQAMQKINSSVSIAGNVAVTSAMDETGKRIANDQYNKAAALETTAQTSSLQSIGTSLNQIDNKKGVFANSKGAAGKQNRDTLKALKQENKELQNKETWMQKHAKTYKTTKEQEDAYIKTVSKHREAVQKLAKTTKDGIKVNKNYKKNIENNKEALNEVVRANRQAGQEEVAHGKSLDSISNRMDNFINRLKSGQINIVGFAQTFVDSLQSLATGAMAFSMMTSSVESLTTAFAEGNVNVSTLTSGIASLLMGVVMFLPVLGKMTTGLSKMIKTRQAINKLKSIGMTRTQAEMLLNKKATAQEVAGEDQVKQAKIESALAENAKNLGKGPAGWAIFAAAMAGIIAIGALVGVGINSVNVSAQKQQREDNDQTIEETQSALEVADGWKTEAEAMDDLIAKHNELSQATNQTIEDQKALADSQQAIIDQVPKLIEKYKELDKEYEDLNLSSAITKLEGAAANEDVEQIQDITNATDNLIAENVSKKAYEGQKAALGNLAFDIDEETGDTINDDGIIEVHVGDNNDSAGAEKLASMLGVETDGSGIFGGAGVSIELDTTDPKKFKETYETLRKFQTAMEEAGDVTDDTYVEVKELLSATKETYDKLTQLMDDGRFYEFTNTMKNTLKIDPSTIENYDEFIKQREKFLAAIDKEDQEEAKMFFDSQKALSNYALLEKQALAYRDKYGKSLYDDMLLHAKHFTDEELTAYLKIDFDKFQVEKTWNDLTAIIQQLDKGDALSKDVSTIMGAAKNLKADGTREDYLKLQESITWGEKGFIKFSNFLKLSFEEQQQYMQSMSISASQRVVREQEMALNKAKDMRQKLLNIIQTSEDDKAIRKAQVDLANLEDEIENINIKIGLAKQDMAAARKEQAQKQRDRKNNIKSLEEEYDAYRYLNELSEDLARNTERLSQEKENLYGADYITALEAEIEAIETENTLLDKTIELANTRASQKKKELTEQYQAQFDDYGNFSNYNEIQAKYLRDLGSITAAQGTDSDAYKAKKDEYDNFKKLAEDYNEDLEKMEEATDQKAENIRETLDKKLEGIEYIVNIKLEINERALGRLESLLDRLDDDAYDSAARMTNYTEQINKHLADIETNKTAIEDTLRASNVSEADINNYMSGKQVDFSKYNLNPQSIEQIATYTDGIIESEEALNELNSTVKDELMTTFGAWHDKLDEQADLIETQGNILSNYQNIIDLMGKDKLGLDDAIMRDMRQTSMEIAKSSMLAAKASKETTEATLKEVQAKKAAAAEGSEEYKYWEDQEKQLMVQLTEDTETFTSMWQEAINKAYENFEAASEQAIENLRKAILGIGKGMSEALELYNKTNSRYISDYEKAYELNKLNRTLETQLSKTDSKRAQKLLRDFQDELNAKQAEGVKMSKQDVALLQKRYELKLAEIALEESQNAKTQVRLSRDSEGNYSYVYTADQLKIEEAEQKYEDLLYQTNKLNEDYLNSLSEQIISNREEMIDKLAALDIADYANYEDYLKARDELIQVYTGQEQFLFTEIQKTLNSNKQIYLEDVVKFQEHNTLHNTAAKTWTFDFEQTKIAIIGKYGEIGDAMSQLVIAIGNGIDTGYTGTMKTAYDDLYTNVSDIMSELGISMDNFNKATDTALGETEGASKHVKDFKKALLDAMYGEGGTKDAPTGGVVKGTNDAKQAITDYYEEATDKLPLITTAIDTWWGAVDPQIEDAGKDTNTLVTALSNLQTQCSTLNTTNAVNNIQNLTNAIGNIGTEIAKLKDMEFKITANVKVDTGDYDPNATDRKSTIHQADTATWTQLKENDGQRKGVNEHMNKDNSFEVVQRQDGESYAIYAQGGNEAIWIDNNTLDDVKFTRVNSAVRMDQDGNLYVTARAESDSTDKSVKAGNEYYIPYHYVNAWGDKRWAEDEQIKSKYRVGAQVSQASKMFAAPEQKDGSFSPETANKPVYGPNYEYGLRMTTGTILKSQYKDGSWWYRFATKDGNGTYYHWIVGKALSDEVISWKSYDTGGYTGSWGPEGRLAMLHQKEIVLNAHDTENLLSIISMVRDMNDRIELNARAMQYGLSAAYTANNIKSQNDTLQQEVHITAEFPNATNHSEIEEAFRNLTNLASQYANRKF